MLLKSVKATPQDPRGYVCKLADFGLSRVLGTNRTHVSTNTYGVWPTPSAANCVALSFARIMQPVSHGIALLCDGCTMGRRPDGMATGV